MDEKEKFVIIAFAKDCDILVASLDKLEPIHFLEGHKARVISINYDLYYRRLISLSKDKTVRIWDIDKIMETEEKEYLAIKNAKLNSSTGAILALAFCKLSQKYAVAHENGEINIYSASDNRLVDQLISHNGEVRCLTYDKAGKLYAAGSDGVVRIWNL